MLFFRVNSMCHLSLTSVSSYDKKPGVLHRMVDDDEQPAGHSGNETNGGANSFEDDSGSRGGGGGVGVRALYDYEGHKSR